MRSGCPISGAKGSYNKRGSILNRIGIQKFWFLGEGKSGVPGEKPLGAEKGTNNKTDPHETPSPGIEPLVTLVGGQYSHHYTSPAPNGREHIQTNGIEKIKLYCG